VVNVGCWLLPVCCLRSLLPAAFRMLI
jgi:hypothetical protein